MSVWIVSLNNSSTRLIYTNGAQNNRKDSLAAGPLDCEALLAGFLIVALQYLCVALPIMYIIRQALMLRYTTK